MWWPPPKIPHAQTREKSMRIAALVGTIALLASFSAHASPDSSVHVELGTYTFPELAQKLSTDGRTVTCAPSLRNRAALVRLNNRTWDDAVKILSAGLDVRFEHKEAAKESWEMSRDQDVAARERRWRRTLMNALRDELNWKIDSRLTIAGGYGDLYRQYEPLYEALEKARQEDGRDSHSPRIKQAEEAVRSSDQKFLPQAWLAELVLRAGLSGDLTDLIARDTPLHPVNLSQVADLDSLKAAWAVAHHLPGEPYQLDKLLALHPLPSDFGAYIGLAFDPFGFALSVQVALFGDRKLDYPNGMFAAIGPISIASLFSGYHDNERTNYAGLGAEAVEWLTRERESTESFLGSPAARQAVEWRKERSPDCVSDFVAEWSAQSDHDVVMELSPARERLDIAGVRGSQDIRPRARYTLAGLDVSRSFWTFVDVAGALAVKDRVAFVDRACEYPFESFLKLDRKLGKRSELMIESSDLSLEDQLEYASAAPQRSRYDWWRSYRGIPMANVQANCPMLSLIKNMGERPRKEMLDSILNGKEYTVGLSSLPRRSVELLVNGYRILWSRSPLFLRPDVADIFRASEIRFMPSPGKRPEDRVVRVTISPGPDVPEWAQLDLYTDCPLATVTTKQ
jgi:hypothetical protein